jgi:Uma2 family endonuclease
MGADRRTKGYTFDDFCALVKEGEKADLIEGVIYMASPDNIDANDLFVWLLRLLADIVENKDLGKVNGSRAAYRFNQANSPEPDVALIRRGRTNLVRRGFVNGPPDLAIEIVSPDSVERDYETKRDLYQDAGVQEYWIVDEVEEKKLRCSGLRPTASTVKSALEKVSCTAGSCPVFGFARIGCGGALFRKRPMCWLCCSSAYLD